MKALGIVPGTTKLELLEMEQPHITAPDEVLIRVERVGICGTDHEIAAGRYGEAKPGASYLVLGHEMLGRVIEVGAQVESLKASDLVVPTVRRGCGECIACCCGQSDMCFTGNFTERGIIRADGYIADYVVEKEEYLVPVPAEIEDVAVLLEPLSIVEKAVGQVVAIQCRLPWGCPHPEHHYSQPGWGQCKRALIAGAGPIGMLAAFVLRANEVTTYVMATRPRDSLKAHLVEEIGAHYISIHEGSLPEIAKKIGNIDIIIEATGAATLGFQLIGILGRNGILAFVGIPSHGAEFKMDGSAFLRERVLLNQVLLGSVNANRRHFEKGIMDLKRFKDRFDGVIEKIITHRYPFAEYVAAFSASDPDLIKLVLEMS